MTELDIVQQRLHSQHISRQTFAKPGDVVEWLGAVQAQDYAAAKWALGLRLQGTTDDAIEQAFSSGAILRTHIMRPTWHFVAPADIRWLLALTAPRVNAAAAYWYRRLELDDSLFARSNTALTKALQGGKQLTRPELITVLQQAGIATAGEQRLTYILFHAELDGIVCSGAMRGKQFTYATLDERAPQASTFDREEALAALSSRYFTSHGPATLQDFVWWSGLTMADARAGLAMVKSHFAHEEIGGQTYWFSSSTPSAKVISQDVYLLPNFDEYIVGYTDRSAIFDTMHTKNLDARGNVLFTHTIVRDGRIVGTWKRTLKKDEVVITPDFFAPLSEAGMRAFAAAAERYGEFLRRVVNVTLGVG
ncbi:MAG: winged helix DNA-binding domain-containing protein [Chloroflexota bacterium]|nr:winged helix DNA-binding domain-containing protein [Chloroflexota bacterium]